MGVWDRPGNLDMVKTYRRVLKALMPVMDDASSSHDMSTAEAPMNDDLRDYTPWDTGNGAELVVESGQDRRQLSLASKCSQGTGEVRELTSARHVSERRLSRNFGCASMHIDGGLYHLRS